MSISYNDLIYLSILDKKTAKQTENVFPKPERVGVQTWLTPNQESDKRNTGSQETDDNHVKWRHYLVN